MRKQAFRIICMEVCLLGILAGTTFGQQESHYSGMAGLPQWMTIAAYGDFGYRTTQFFEPDFDTIIFLGDSRIEFWLPPGRDDFSWGPYLRFAGIVGDRPEAWQNAWLALPGAGFQVYPFSQELFTERAGWLGGILGPLRLFAEYNRVDYWGDENRWRPDEQVRAGAEYWHSVYVNDPNEALWGEIWSGLFWQSANEFDPHYDSVIFANALRAGVRVPKAGLLSLFAPYGVLESSLTDNEEYYWENRLLAGFGIRVAPRLRYKPGDWLTRLVVYAEYLRVIDYYHTEAPSPVPEHDFRIGVNLAIGDWYR